MQRQMLPVVLIGPTDAPFQLLVTWVYYIVGSWKKIC